ncbi:hypothetical protein ACT8ZV_22365 [Nocardioides sp. MAHUQ-72]|uniref:hypothetical protein n=1 Tax=unclassified Nocardioides TaxID=2615069 RepID=UPI00360C2A01
MIDDPQVRRTSRRVDRRREALIRRTHRAPRPPLAALGALVALVVAAFLLVAQWEIYPTGSEAQTNGLWALGFAIATAGGALRILVGQPGRHLASVVALLGSGVGLLLRALLAGHEVGATAISEEVCGGVLVACGLVALASPATSVDQLPGQPDG